MNIQLVLSTNIRELIKEKGLKQKAVANQCSADEKVFCNMLCNSQENRTEILLLIVSSLDVLIKDLSKTGDK